MSDFSNLKDWIKSNADQFPFHFQKMKIVCQDYEHERSKIKTTKKVFYKSISKLLDLKRYNDK
jgi:hypothetical protein